MSAIYRQRDHFENCYIFVARHAGCRASHVALVVAVGRRVGVWKVTRFSCLRVSCRRVPRRVPNRARVSVSVFRTF